MGVSAEGLSLPVGLVPPGAGVLTPTKIDVAATFKGIDIAAGANEAIADMSLQGDGPLISDEDSAKVEAALLSAGPIRIEFAPSHIVAPAIDADFVGAIRYEHGRVSAAMTIHMRGFDKTMAAVKAMGPDVAGKAMPVPCAGQGARQERKRRQPQLGRRTGQRPLDESQRNPIRQGAGISAPRAIG